MGDITMESRRFYPPQKHLIQMPYHILARGNTDCRLELLDQPWEDRISGRDGILFVGYVCKKCGR